MIVQADAQTMAGIIVRFCILTASLCMLVVAEIRKSVFKSYSAFKQLCTARKLRKKCAHRALQPIATHIRRPVSAMPMKRLKELAAKKPVRVRISAAVTVSTAFALPPSWSDDSLLALEAVLVGCEAL